MSIILIRGGVATRVPHTEFALESVMQSQIAANPGILPLHEIRDGASLVVVVREFAVASGYIDLLGFDAEGEIYIIETKLGRNPDRRTVVAQALDYGAALWSRYEDATAYFGAIDELRTRDGQPRLAEALRAAHGDDEGAVSRVFERITQNLRNGAFRFVIPMDRIDDELKDLVRYVNANSRFTVYLVELEQYQDRDLTVVVPRLFGAETRKSVGSSTNGSRGGPGSAVAFLEDLERRVAAQELSDRDADAVRDVLGLVTAQDARHNWFKAVDGRVSVSPRFPATGATRSPFTLRSDGRFMLNRGYVAEVQVWSEWIDGVLSMLERDGDSRKFPEFKLEEWGSHAARLVSLAESVVRGAS